MREGWKYKKLGDICEIERGGSPRPIQQYITDDEDGLNWIKIGDAIEGSKYINSTKEKIKKEGLKKTRFVHKGDFILSNSMSFGKPYILGIDGCIHDGWLVIRDTSNFFDKSFLYYLLGSPNMYNEFKRLAVGGVVNNLNSQLVRSVSVPIPPLSEQERIVFELDLLSSIIEKKKVQLKEYDQLAQSIFYDMFGDPVTNEKGWEVKKLGELCSLITKGTTPPSIGFPFVDEGVNFVKVESFVDGRIDNSKLSHITHECNLALIRSKLQNKDLLVCIAGATIGKMAVVDSSILPANTNQACAILRLKDNKIIRYIQSYLELKFEYDVKQMGKGVAQPNLSLGQLRNLLIPMPPIEQRECFKTKIEAIEKQKELIKQSITEAETLFNSRMDYWFN